MKENKTQGYYSPINFSIWNQTSTGACEGIKAGGRRREHAQPYLWGETLNEATSTSKAVFLSHGFLLMKAVTLRFPFSCKYPQKKTVTLDRSVLDSKAKFHLFVTSTVTQKLSTYSNPGIKACMFTTINKQIYGRGPVTQHSSILATHPLKYTPPWPLTSFPGPLQFQSLLPAMFFPIFL